MKWAFQNKLKLIAFYYGNESLSSPNIDRRLHAYIHTYIHRDRDRGRETDLAKNRGDWVDVALAITTREHERLCTWREFPDWYETRECTSVCLLSNPSSYLRNKACWSTDRPADIHWAGLIESVCKNKHIWEIEIIIVIFFIINIMQARLTRSLFWLTFSLFSIRTWANERERKNYA